MSSKKQNFIVKNFRKGDLKMYFIKNVVIQNLDSKIDDRKLDVLINGLPAEMLKLPIDIYIIPKKSKLKKVKWDMFKRGVKDLKMKKKFGKNNFFLTLHFKTKDGDGIISKKMNKTYNGRHQAFVFSGEIENLSKNKSMDIALLILSQMRYVFNDTYIKEYRDKTYNLKDGSERVLDLIDKTIKRHKSMKWAFQYLEYKYGKVFDYNLYK